MSDAFYLKYRPQKVNQLDLENIKEELTRVLSSAKIPHAFLFVGSKGLGKTSAARIVAKSVNCLKKEKGKFEPCNKCQNCLRITSGIALDLLEIDAASNRGIDDIRELKEKIRLTPVEMKKKVYVIDEVHMLTTEAFNALLKTLEEPPRHVLFILCTTEAHKLPETIKSRCLILNFKKANTKELIRSLERVVKGENLKVAEGVLRKIAEMADGSFRDATKIIEQLSFVGKVIKEKDFDNLFKETSFWGPEFFQLLKDKKTKKLFIAVDNLVKTGGDLKSFTSWILYVLRAMLLLKFGVETETENLKISHRDLSSCSFELEEIKKLIVIFDQASRELKTAFIPQLPIEMAIAKWCEDSSKLIRQQADQSSKPQSIILKDKTTIKKNYVVKNSTTFESVKEKWQEFLNKIKSKNHSIVALLKASEPLKIEGDSLIIKVFYEFHKGRLESHSCTQIVQKTICEVFNHPMKVRYFLGKKKNKPAVKKEDSVSDSNNDEELIKTAEEIFTNNK